MSNNKDYDAIDAENINSTKLSSSHMNIDLNTTRIVASGFKIATTLLYQDKRGKQLSVSVTLLTRSKEMNYLKILSHAITCI